MMYITYADSFVGVLTLVSADGATLSGLWIDGQKYDHALLGKEIVRECETNSLAIFWEAARWLKPYSSGQESNFYPWFSLGGSEFRKEITREMPSIPYGCTTSYKQPAESLAARQGKDHVSSHATGGAVAYNPLLTLIPHHRIIGVSGHLAGYADGLERKKCLLALETGQL